VARENKRHAEQTKRLLKWNADRGVKEVHIDRHADGSATVAFAGFPDMELSPRLAVLFESLCVDAGQTHDALIGYKRVTDLSAMMSRRTNSPVTTRALTMAIWRLRRRLELVVGNPYYVQGRKPYGYRFALRRGFPPVIGKVT